MLLSSLFGFVSENAMRGAVDGQDGRRRLRLVGYLLALAAAAIYLWRFVGRGWIPHDEGMLAQIAERILAGQLPHRDFDDPYTGGLGYLHAMAFLVFGVRIVSLRIVLFLAALAWMPAVFAVARRFVSSSSAAFVTAAAVAWTLPNYFASMPSYYNLFLATWGTAALLRHLDTNSRIWLFIAGLCGGFSFLIKSSGAYFLGAAILFLLYREQLQQQCSTKQRSLAVFVAKTAFGLLFLTGLAGLVIAHPGTTEFLHFFVPGAALIAILLSTEWSGGRGAASGRMRGFALLLLPFLAGVLLPIALFIMPYIVTGSMSAWYDGVFVAPRSRFSSAAVALPPLITMLAALPYGLVLLAGVSRWRMLDRGLGVVLLTVPAVIAVLPVAGGAVDPIYRFGWYSVPPPGASNSAGGIPPAREREAQPDYVRATGTVSACITGRPHAAGADSLLGRHLLLLRGAVSVTGGVGGGPKQLDAATLGAPGRAGQLPAFCRHLDQHELCVDIGCAPSPLHLR